MGSLMYLLFGFTLFCLALQHPDAALWAFGGYVAVLLLQRRR